MYVPKMSRRRASELPPMPSFKDNRRSNSLIPMTQGNSRSNSITPMTPHGHRKSISMIVPLTPESRKSISIIPKKKRKSSSTPMNQGSRKNSIMALSQCTSFVEDYLNLPKSRKGSAVSQRDSPDLLYLGYPGCPQRTSRAPSLIQTLLEGDSVEEYIPAFALKAMNNSYFRQIFDMYDKNGDNVINVEELRGILEILGYTPTPEEVKTILERFDQDKSGTIDFEEYLVLIQHWIEQDEEQIYEAFKVFDKDGDGFVSAQELKRALTQYGEQFTEEEANEFFNMMDTDGDGVINYEEFVEYLRSMQKYSD